MKKISNSQLNFFRMKNQWYFILLLFIMATISLSSCYAEVDPAAANSSAGCLAVLGEYFFALCTFLLVAVLWLFRTLGFATVVCALLALAGVWKVSVSAPIMFVVGLIMFMVSFIPLTPHNPVVIIANNPNIKDRIRLSVSKPKPWWKDAIVNCAVGLVLLVVEYLLFVE